MPPCPHVQWLELDGIAPDWSVVDPNRLGLLVKDLPQPEKQLPSLVFFLGKRAKTSSLKSLFARNNVTRRNSHGLGNLYVDHRSIDSEQPLLFVDCSINANCANSLGPWNGCHDNHRYGICYDSSDGVSRLKEVVSHVHLNLLFPFALVVCLFADDLGGNSECAEYVTDWLRMKERATQSSMSASPHLVIVTADPTDIDALIQAQCHSRFDSCFESLTVLSVTSQGQIKLDAELKRVTDAARKERQDRHLLFCASDMARMFALAVRAFARCPQSSTDFPSCLAHPASLIPAANLQRHLNAFVKAATSLHWSLELITEFMASALLAQAYPVHTHRRNSLCHSGSRPCAEAIQAFLPSSSLMLSSAERSIASK